MHPQQKYTRLRNTILITTLIFALLPMLLVGITIPMQFSELYHQKTVREVENVAQTKGKSIDIFFEERIALLNSLAQLNSFDELTRPGRLSSILHVMRTNSQSYVDLGVIDMDGNHVAYAGSYNVSKVNYKNEPWFSEVQRRGTYVSDVFLGFRNFPHVIIAVMREDGERSWILRATVDSAVLNQMVQSSRLSDTGDAFVLNHNGELQTPSNKKAAMEALPVVWPAKGSPVTTEEEFLGQTMMLCKVPLTTVPWMLVVAENPKEHFSLLFNARALAILVVLAGVTALCVGTWLTTRTIVNRLISVDKEKASLDAVVLQSSKMAALGKLAAGVAHEINNPLMLIREHAGWIKDLLEDLKNGRKVDMDEIYNAAAKVEQNVDRAKDVTHRLLGFARRIDPTSESLPLSPIIEQTIGFLQSEAGFRGISIKRDFSSLDLRVQTDVGQLQQVILNIIDNAIDASPVNGQVTVSTGLSSEGKAYIQVQDNGPGISKGQLDSIFDPFFTTKEPGEGTGLGLSICYSIMNSLGGSIEAGNAPEGGAVFTIILPTCMHEE